MSLQWVQYVRKKATCDPEIILVQSDICYLNVVHCDMMLPTVTMLP